MVAQKVVLITGASSGIGYQTAKKLAAQQFKVYGAARRVDRLTPLVQLGVSPIYMDITDDETITKAVAHIIEASGRIDILINNAGYESYGAIENVHISEAKKQFDTNLFGLAKLTQLVLPYMRAQQSGRIIRWLVE